MLERLDITWILPYTAAIKNHGWHERAPPLRLAPRPSPRPKFIGLAAPFFNSLHPWLLHLSSYAPKLAIHENVRGNRRIWWDSLRRLPLQQSEARAQEREGRVGGRGPRPSDFYKVSSLPIAEFRTLGEAKFAGCQITPLGKFISLY